MKLVKNILSALVALPLVAGLASCSEKEAEYSPAAAIANDEVYFVSPNATVELDETKDVAYVDINRVKTADEINVPLNVTCTNSKIIPVTSVTFAAGDTVAHIPVSYDPEIVEAGKFDTLTIEISSADYTTPYGSSSVTVLIGKAQTWTTLGTGQFMDTFWDENYYDVKIQQCDQQPNMYRILDPYANFGLGHQGDDLVFYVYDKGEDLGGWTVPFDGFVFYEPCNCGYYYSSYGQYIYDYHPWYFSKYRDEGANYNYVKDYQEDGTPGYISLSSYYYMSGVGGWNYTTGTSMEIVMPGYVLADYSASISYAGKFIDTEDAVSVVADVTLGADVKSARIGILAGKDSEEGLDSVAASGQEITAGGEYKIAMPADAASGNYTLYVVTFNGDGLQQEYAYDTFRYTAPGAAETWTPKYVGTWTYSLYAFCNEDGTPYDDEGLVLSQCDQDPNQWMIEHLWNDVTFYFTWDQSTNTINFDTQFTGANYGYGDIYAVDMTTYGYDASHFDTESNTFSFDIYYVDDTYSWGYGWETFKLTGTAQAAKRALAHKAAARKHLTSKSNAKAVPVKVAGKVKKASGKVADGIKNVKFEKMAF